MSDTPTEELYLAAEGSPADRDRISEKEIADVVREEIEGIQMSLKRIRVAYFLLGMKVTDPFYQMMRSTMYSGDRTHLCPRVRFDPRYQTPSFSWERIEQHVLPGHTGHKPKKEKGKGRSYMAFVRMKGAARKEKAKVVLTSRHLKINPKTHSLSAAAFEGEPEWAKVAGELIETKLSVLRRQNRALSNISRAVHRFKSLVHEKESSSEVVV